MAKRKLSADQRAELRAVLKAGPQGEESNADLLRRVAKNFGITTITARWYQKAGGGAPKRRGSGKRGRPVGRRSVASSPDLLLRKADERLRTAKAAKKIAPRLKRLLAKQKELAKAKRRIDKRLEATSDKVTRLRDQMASLVG